jgi:hypothetical protein
VGVAAVHLGARPHSYLDIALLRAATPELLRVKPGSFGRKNCDLGGPSGHSGLESKIHADTVQFGNVGCLDGWVQLGASASAGPLVEARDCIDDCDRCHDWHGGNLCSFWITARTLLRAQAIVGPGRFHLTPDIVHFGPVLRPWSYAKWRCSGSLCADHHVAVSLGAGGHHCVLSHYASGHKPLYPARPNFFSETNDRLWRTRRPSTSLAHCRLSDQF